MSSIVKVLKHQAEALTSQNKYTLMLTGVGGGKTWTGAHWVVKQALEHPKSLGFIGANTYSQLQNSTLHALFEQLDQLKIAYSYNKSNGYLTFLDKLFLCKSMDNFDAHRGIEIGEFWIDEAAYMQEDAFNMICGRLRDKKGPLKGFLTTTPKGYNWCQKYFDPNGELFTDDYRLIRATSYANRHLPEGYIDSLKGQYDDKLFEQEIMGQFVNLTQGQCYYAFDEEMHVNQVKPSGLPMWAGQDFNVDPMAGCAGYVMNDCLYVTDEMFLRNSNSYEAGELWKAMYGPMKIVPDSTGKNRKSSGATDFAILEEYGHQIIYSRNPHVLDRVNNLNRLLKMNRIVIDPSCKKLINDLKKVSWVDGKQELDQKSDKLLTHISDSLGYLAWYLFPMYEERKSRTIRL